jgi:hypothetical protein
MQPFPIVFYRIFDKICVHLISTAYPQANTT